MRPDYSFLVAVLAMLLAMDAAAAIAVFAAKAIARRARDSRAARMKRIDAALLDADPAVLGAEFRADPWRFLSQLRRAMDRVRLPAASLSAAKRAFGGADLEAMAAGRIRSPFLHRRIDAYCCLGLLDAASASEGLVAALGRERRAIGRLVLLDRIARHASPPGIPGLLDSAGRGDPRFRAREAAALRPMAGVLKRHFDGAGAPSDETGLRIYLMAAEAFPAERDFAILEALAIDDSHLLGESAAELLFRLFPASRFSAAFGERKEPRFRRRAIALSAGGSAAEGLAALDPWLNSIEYRKDAIAAAASILERHPGSEPAFLERIEKGGEESAAALSAAIGHRLPALLYHASAPLGPGLARMAALLARNNESGTIARAVASPMPGEVRAELLGILRSELPKSPEASAVLSRALGAEDSAALGLPPPAPEPDRPRMPISAGDKAFLAALAAAGLLLLPAVFLLWRGPALAGLSAPELGYRFLFDFQYLFSFYTLAVNGIYLALLGLSIAKLASESLLWERDLSAMLFAPGILPRISIIVPAYNEEKTIVESMSSLLSLSYPSYEIIAVNDGSKDGTMSALASAFDLELAGSGGSGVLETMPVRAVYRSNSVPGLFVVDKANGGKADALNAGLNIAKGEFSCTIDADSILDPQSLLRMMFQAMACDEEILAVGGNVFPVNGCAVEHGHLQEIVLSRDPLVRFQVIEYLRSFVGGRLGWTAFDALLIVSGAFGLFRRSAIVELGGYLSGTGRFRHETVGEDMEIVVRLKRRDRERGGKGKVVYAYNANCWTEVPDRWAAYARQRDRWHRGLMEVLCFHRSMAFRPRYGGSGMLSLPYFFLFELIGPWLESQGYLMLAAILAFNLVDPIVPLTVFGIAVSFGALISILSFLLAERQILRFKAADFFKLLGMSFMESLGFRQAAGFLRVKANAEFFFRRKGWGALARRGFARRAP